MISYSLPFPPVCWFNKALQDDKVEIYIKLNDKYAKMSYRNRYYLTGAQGKMLLSIPVKGGRNQHTPMKDVLIDNSDNWQKTHFKTIETLYRRSPYYEFIIPYLLPLFENKYEKLHRWNFDGLQLLQKLLKLPKNIIEISDNKLAENEKANHFDISPQLLPNKLMNDCNTKQYYQLFADKVGFQENCSILDYIFCEGIKLNF